MPYRFVRPPGHSDNYNNGGQDWSTTIPLCGTGMNQSPINVATPVVTYNAPLGPLRVQ